MGSEDNYRDFFFPVYNSDQDSNETGAPILRSQLFFPVDGNHDLGSTGVSANLLADNAAPAFSGNLSGGDALSYFNDFYFPQNGPRDSTSRTRGTVTPPCPPVSHSATRERPTPHPRPSTLSGIQPRLTPGKGAKLQIDHQSNYSFDYGNAHFPVPRRESASVQ